MRAATVSLLVMTALCGVAWAGPVAAPLPPALPEPVDTPWPGTIGLAVDATDTAHHVFNVTETIPVTPGKLTLLYPKFIPGHHSGVGPIAALAGLVITGNGTEIAWQRNTVEPYAFHLEVPEGVASLTLHYQYLSPVTPREGDVVMSSDILDLQWHQEVLYPAGHYVHGITVLPSVTLPAGWQFGTALGDGTRDGDTVHFAAVKLDVLIDSPLYAGRYFARFDLAPGAKVPAHMDVVADAPEDLAITPPDLQAHRNLVAQAAKNFASQHYDHFDFLVSLSDEITFAGLEHHRSSENGHAPDYFLNPNRTASWRDLLPHEYTHSWDGKFRRPADLWAPDYTVVPERGSLLWVYEGQTEYWGQVLAARAGLLSPEQYRDFLALQAADLQAKAGRNWRNVQETTNDPVINERRPQSWSSWSRSEDYYMEGSMIWLDADTLIRERTHGAKSLTNFAQAFFGIEDGNYGEVTYDFNEVATTLNRICPYDWTSFLRARLDDHPNKALLDGLTRGGWQLVFTDTESAMEKSIDGRRHGLGLNYSLGVAVAADGTVQTVQWDSPAFRAGLARGVKILGVDGAVLESPDLLAKAVTRAAKSASPISLLVSDGRKYRTVLVDYHGGLRYPHLERIAGTEDRLGAIIQPLK